MQFDKGAEIPSRLILGQDPAHPDLVDIAATLRDMVGDEFLNTDAPIIPGSAREALLKVYRIDEAAHSAGATEVNVQLEIFGGKADSISWSIPSTNSVIERLHDINPDMDAMSSGEQALYAFEKCGYMQVGFAGAVALLQEGTEADRAMFIPELVEYGTSAMWASAIAAFPEESLQQRLALEVASSFDCKRAVEALKKTDSEAVQSVLAELILEDGDGFQLKDLVKCCSHRFDGAVVDKLIERYRNPDDEKEFVKLGLKLVATEVATPARQTLLAFFLEEEDPDFAQIALQCLPPDASQRPFGNVLFSSENRQYIGYALRLEDQLYDPLRRELALLFEQLTAES